MIDYVVATNPDQRVINRALYFLEQGQIIVLPTDTNWVCAADLMNKKAVECLYEIKGLDRKKHLSLICENISQASRYAIISDRVFRMINKAIPGPYTFIFKPTKDIPRSIKDYKKQSEIGIRIPDSIICHRIIKNCHHPIITTSITRDMMPPDNSSEVLTEEIFSYQIEEFLGNKVAMIIDPGEYHLPQAGSTIIDFSNELEEPVILREGAGDVSIF